MSEPVPDKPASTPQFLPWLAVVWSILNILVKYLPHIAAVGVLGYFAVSPLVSWWQSEPAAPAAPITLISPSVAKVGIPFTVTYESTSPAAWLDPQEDGLFIHGGPEIKVGRGSYKGEAGVVLTKAGTFTFGVAVVSGGVIAQEWAKTATDGPLPPTPQPLPPGPPIPPVPPKPDPKPPQPASSFRVLLVYESAKTLTAAQNSVMNGKLVRDYLTANTTPENGWAGWREFDKDANADKDSPTIKALWAAVKPQLTTVPCVVVEVNGHAEIIPFAATPAEMVATFDKYKGGK